MRLRYRTALIVGLSLAASRPSLADSGCNGCPPFPVPRAEAEFRELLEVPRAFAKGGAVSLERAFVNLLPYGPLDLEITGAATHDEISKLKNYYFGAVCRIIGADPSRLNVVFNCGRRCVEDRRDRIKASLDSWSDVAAKFRAATGVKLVGAWGVPAGYRVNDVIKAGEEVLVAEPSPVMGFIPGGRFFPRSSLAEAFSERGIDPEQVQVLLDSMMQSEITAARYRAAGGVELIHIGIADNLSGVLFLQKGEPRPEKGLEHENGSRYVLVERLAKDTYFFETR